MENDSSVTCSAFLGFKCIASGELSTVAEKTKAVIDRGEQENILIFDDVTGRQIEIDFRGTVADVLERVKATTAKSDESCLQQNNDTKEKPRGRGRPKLGVVGREVTLLPSQWDWLSRQPGGASVTIRKLVNEAKRSNIGKDRIRQSQEAAYRFMNAMAGNLPGFEEATRALFACNSERFYQLIEDWYPDVRNQVKNMAARVFE